MGCVCFRSSVHAPLLQCECQGVPRFCFSPLVTNDDALKPEVIRTMVHGDLLYRARYVKEFGDADKIIKDPAGQFGPTPRFLASSQRMTPNGISALYCALERETCLSEIRSITGDNVVSAALTPVAELKLLDLTVLNRVEPRSCHLWMWGIVRRCIAKSSWARWSRRCPGPRLAMMN